MSFKPPLTPPTSGSDIDEVMKNIIEKLNKVLSNSINNHTGISYSDDESISETVANLVSAYEKLHNIKRIKELFLESEKRNGELAHENFELKKRIAELEEIDIVHCGECYFYPRCREGISLDSNWFCADGERKGAK